MQLGLFLRRLRRGVRIQNLHPAIQSLVPAALQVAVPQPEPGLGWLPWFCSLPTLATSSAQSLLEKCFRQALWVFFSTVAMPFIGLAVTSLLVINVGLVFNPFCDDTLVSNTSFCRFVQMAHANVARNIIHQTYPEVFRNLSNSVGDIVSEVPLVKAVSIDLTTAHTNLDDIMLEVKHANFPTKSIVLGTLDGLRAGTWEGALRLQAFGTKLDGAAERIVMAHVGAKCALATELSTWEQLRDNICSLPIIGLIRCFCPPSRAHRIEQNYRHALEVVDNELSELSVEAFLIMGMLEGLSEGYRSVFSLAGDEEVAVTGAREELVGQFLTILGFNRKQISEHDKTVRAVVQVREYAGNARSYIVQVYSRLHFMKEEVSQFRRTAKEASNPDWVDLENAIGNMDYGIRRIQVSRSQVKFIAPGTQHLLSSN